jgi:hypothetical protein
MWGSATMFGLSMERCMRFALAATIFVLGTGSSFAQSAPVFAPNGQYLGTAVKNGNTTVFVDKNGKYGGAVVQNHNGMTIIDKNGQHSIRPPQWNARLLISTES